jgi:hypothetical protein
MRVRRSGSGFLAALLLAGPSGAATVYVAQEGTDGPACGAKATPCRSISQGIDVAGAGDTIRVGPGRYGDLNGDGAFDDPGDELGELGSGCNCMIRVAKRLTLLSEAGAGATVIDGAGNAPTLVEIAADGVVFGRANQGFSLTRSGPNQLQGALEVKALSGVSIAGNTTAHNTGIGFSVEGGSHALSDNRATDSYLGFLIVGGSSLARNLSASNDFGVQIEGQGIELRDDVVAANRFVGLVVVTGSTDVLLSRVQVLGNGGRGIVTGAPLVLRGGRIVGNDAGDMNCGVEVATGGALDAEAVFWGAATGPGDDPADFVCAETGTTLDTDPPAKKAGKVKLKPLR